MKKSLFLSILISTSLFLHAQTQSVNVRDVQRSPRNQTSQQEQNRGFQRENLRFGGSLGAQFGDITFIDISPAVGYQFTRHLQAGIGIVYNYYSFRNPFTSDRLSTNIFGVSPFAQFAAVQTQAFHLFLRAECGFLSHRSAILTGERGWVLYPLIGGGALLPVGQAGQLSIQVLWDVNEKEQGRSIYGENPIFRIGFMFGL